MSTTLTNLPKLSEALAPDLIKQMIEAETEPLKKRRDELVGSCKRFVEQHPDIDSDEKDNLATEVMAVCARFITAKTGRVDTAREVFKKPVLDATNAIGSAAKGPFADIAAAVEIAMQPIKRASINYKTAKDEKIRKENELEAKRKADEAAMLEKLASRRTSNVSMIDAAQSAADAEAARKLSTASVANLTRSHGDNAGVSSLKWKRTATVVNPALVPREYCSPDMSKINDMRGKPKTPFPVIAGIEFKDEPDLTIGR